LTLATPNLAGQAGVFAASETPDSIKRKDQNSMNINRVTLAGFAGKDARSGSTQNGRSLTRLSVATTRRHKDAEGNWQEKTQWHTCVAYGLSADHAAKIQTGDHVFLEGELIHREYERTVETDGGPVKVLWPVAEIVIESISVIDRKEKQERRGAA
jgi:single-strand DNA-binding protein